MGLYDDSTFLPSNGLHGGRGYFEGAAKREEVQHHVAAIETDAGAAPPQGFTSTLEGKSLDALTRRTAVLNRIAPMTFTSSKHTGADTSPLIDAGVVGYGCAPTRATTSISTTAPRIRWTR